MFTNFQIANVIFILVISFSCNLKSQQSINNQILILKIEQRNLEIEFDRINLGGMQKSKDPNDLDNKLKQYSQNQTKINQLEYQLFTFSNKSSK